MTVNAIVTGCNQKSNRDPLTALDDADVENTLNDLINLGVVELIDWVGRTAKYKHLAVLKPIVDALVQRGLMIELTPPGRGQIVSHNLYPSEELQEVRARMSGSGPAGAGVGARERVASAPSGRSAERPSAANEEIAELRAEIVDLRRRVQELEKKLDSRGD